jgi:hypothetical protein
LLVRWPTWRITKARSRSSPASSSGPGHEDDHHPRGGTAKRHAEMGFDPLRSIAVSSCRQDA